LLPWPAARGQGAELKPREREPPLLHRRPGATCRGCASAAPMAATPSS
jgi:hypothetical protein